MQRARRNDDGGLFIVENAFASPMMQFESSDFVLYLFRVMLCKQSNWKSYRRAGAPKVSVSSSIPANRF